MSAKTYKSRALVLRKTKLGERDLIVTMLDQSGVLLRGVAKGARKPGGSFAARLELFAEVDVLMARGRSLDIVCDARFAQPGRCAIAGLEQTLCAAPLAELLCNISQPDLEQPRVFDISEAAFGRISASGDSPRSMLAIASASVWKVLAQAGFRPSFTSCALCAERTGEPVGPTALAIAEGGVICNECMRPADALLVDGGTIMWCEALIRMTYDEVLASALDCKAAMSTIEIARMWARVHAGRDIRSLDLLLTSELFR